MGKKKLNCEEFIRSIRYQFGETKNRFQIGRAAARRFPAAGKKPVNATI
jgi:hypothetical protein